MKRICCELALASVALICCLGEPKVVAQQDQQPPQRRARGNFDPEQFRQRMMERYREQLEVKDDDEWKSVEERITNVTEARRALGLGGAQAAFVGRAGQRSGGAASDRTTPERRRGPRFDSSPEAEALHKAVDSNASADEIKAKLAKYREARKAKESQLAKARGELRKVLNARQEASAVLMGLLD
jgi:hypothetical protein